MHNLVFRWLARLRQNYWFWPSIMTFGAVLLGFALPYLDSLAGTEWIRSVGFLRPTDVDGARAILTTMAGATLGVAGVAFSVTIVAVSFASGNYGPRLISNFMGDRQNQIVLGIFVATFVYCLTVLSTVHTGGDGEASAEAFVPQISLLFAMLLTLTAVGALIAYIHHIPESINIMNLTAAIGDKLQRAVIAMLDAEDARADDAPGRAQDPADRADVTSWREAAPGESGEIVAARAAGFLQQFDLESLVALARRHETQIILHRAPGDFLVTGETVLSAGPVRDEDGAFARQLRDCFTQGTNRTETQDVMFLADQLVEVLGRALSPGINDPHTAMLCLNWLQSGLIEFARRSPSQPARRGDPVLYRRVTFEDMLEGSFDTMRQYIATDRNVTLHALGILAEVAAAASRPPMVDACIRQIQRLAGAARQRLGDPAAHEEIEAALTRALVRSARSR